MELSLAQMLQRKPLHPAEAKAAEATVCVTGATGFIGASIVARLVLAGHTVHGATFPCPDTDRIVELMNKLPGAAKRLRWFYADMRKPGSHDEAVAGCKYVIHTACPVKLSVPLKHAYQQVIGPALEGTKNVLDSVTKAGTVEKVIMTSSIAALLSESPPGHVFSEADWNLDFAKHGSAYEVAKTVSEWEAWAMAAQQDRWRLVTICPGYVYGPPLVKVAENDVIASVRRMMDGTDYPYAAPMGQVTVDVDDVAVAHVLAMVVPQAKGRYFVCERGTTLIEMAGILREKYPQHKIPDKTLPEWFLMAILRWKAWWTGNAGGLATIKAAAHTHKLNCNKARRELGLQLIPLEKSLPDMMERLMAFGMVPPAPAAGRK